MNPETLKSIMTDLEFNTQDLSLLMGVTRRTAQLWASGSSPIPQSVALLLLAMADKQVSLDWMVDQIYPKH